MTKTKTLKKSNPKRLLSIVLALIMAVSFTSISPVTASAASASDPVSNYIGSVTFTGDYTGLYRTINGTKARICVAYKAIDNIYYDYSLGLTVYEYGGRNVYSINLYDHGNKDADGYYFFVSEYFTVHKGVDYRIRYTAFTQGGIGEERRLNCHVWYDVLA